MKVEQEGNIGQCHLVADLISEHSLGNWYSLRNRKLTEGRDRDYKVQKLKTTWGWKLVDLKQNIVKYFFFKL